MIDDLRQMAIFVKIVDHGSFRAAATELNLSPSVVSHHISQLEDKLGLTLLYRSTRRLSPTREGEALLVSARRMIEAAEQGLAGLHQSSNSPSGALKIALPALMPRSQVMIGISDFTKRFPRVKLTLEFSDEQSKLIEDGFDLAIRMAPNRKRAPHRRSLFPVQRFLVAHPDYLSMAPVITHPELLHLLNWIELRPARTSSPFPLKSGENRITVAPKAMVSANNVQAVYQLALAGVGIAILPDFLVNEDLKQQRLLPLLPDWHLDPLDVYVEWPAGATPSVLITQFIESLTGAK